MKFYEQRIKGVWLLEPEPFEDNRGALSRQFCVREFKAHNIETRICQTNLSQNVHKHTLRGFHYQIHPYGEHKTLFCLNGAIYDVVVDLRPESATFLDWISVELSSTNQLGLHLPAGCANAFLTLSPQTMIHYYMSEFYIPESYRGFRYSDPLFSFKWPAKPSVISDKDNSYPDLDPDSFRR